MSSVPAQNPDVAAIPSGSKTRARNTQAGTRYYLSCGLEGGEHKQYRSSRAFTKAIDEQTKEALAGSAGQYVVFRPVSQRQLSNIDLVRNTKRKGLRFTYLNQERALIVKVILGGAHEFANRRFAAIVNNKTNQMGLSREFFDMGGTTLTAPGGLKEGDSTFKPGALRPHESSWPTLVVECGVSQSLARLVVDSHWWLANSGGEVKIVILISVSKPAKHIHFEKWESMAVPNPRVTRANPDAFTARPAKAQELDIYGDAVVGAPLRLEFEKIILRPPQDGEGDMIFDTQQLAGYAADLWNYTQ